VTFYLGAPDPGWLTFADRPLMVSHTRLRRIRHVENLPVAVAPWILDSGGYDVITRHGACPDSSETYVRAVRRYNSRIGKLSWASPRDFPCSLDLSTFLRAEADRTRRRHEQLFDREFAASLTARYLVDTADQLELEAMMALGTREESR
jgi:hypothetical protein